MSEIDSGGPTFPVTKDAAMFSGLTKREYFAGMALQGILARGAPMPSDEVVEWAYLCADAMIRAGKGEK